VSQSRWVLRLTFFTVWNHQWKAPFRTALSSTGSCLYTKLIFRLFYCYAICSKCRQSCSLVAGFYLYQEWQYCSSEREQLSSWADLWHASTCPIKRGMRQPQSNFIHTHRQRCTWGWRMVMVLKQEN
jgi:hypothetical protein